MKTLDNIIFCLEMFVIATPIWSLLGAILQLNDVFIFIWFFSPVIMGVFWPLLTGIQDAIFNYQRTH